MPLKFGTVYFVTLPQIAFALVGMLCVGMLISLFVFWYAGLRERRARRLAWQLKAANWGAHYGMGAKKLKELLK